MANSDPEVNIRRNDKAEDIQKGWALFDRLHGQWGVDFREIKERIRWMGQRSQSSIPLQLSERRGHPNQSKKFRKQYLLQFNQWNASD